MKFLSYSLILVVILSWSEPANEDRKLQKQETSRVDAGRKLFYSNCIACHAVFKNLTGPALVGAERRITKEMYYAIVANPPFAINKYPYFKKQLKEWQSLMTAFPGLKKEDVDNIIEFIKAAEKNPKLDFNPNVLKTTKLKN